MWYIKVKKPARPKVYTWIMLISTLSVVSYGLAPNIRLGLEVLGGYYLWTLSFVLLLVVSIVVQRKPAEALGTEEEQS
jgi:hypothetical protein